MRENLKEAVSNYYSDKHSSFRIETFERCWPIHGPNRSRFWLGLFIGSVLTGAAFAAAISIPTSRFISSITSITEDIVQSSGNTEPKHSSSFSDTRSPDSSSSNNQTSDPEAHDDGADTEIASQIATVNIPENISNEPIELSQRVTEVLQEVQLRQEENQWEEALNEMNALYSEFDLLNRLEQTMLLNFYTNTLIQLEMWEEAISAFSLMTTIPELRSDINARALLSLGQLNERVGNSQASIAYFEAWLGAIEGLQIPEERISSVRDLLENARTRTISDTL